MEMRDIDVLNNLKAHTTWNIENYKMTEAEAKVCIKALEYKIIAESKEADDYKQETGMVT